ncbi:MAG TPA: hypothetical protein VH814_18485 [Steroidobacteraceae bacterium]|jgi:hypothetical protein
MKKKPRYLRTDERLDTEGSLRKAAKTVTLVESDPAEWKWLLIAVHSATQGMFVLALSLGNDLLTLKAKHAAKWLEAYRSGQPHTGKLDLDYFEELYRKAKEHSKFAASEFHDNAIKRLNELRNGFIHFHAQGWSIELAGLPTICLYNLEIVEHLGWRFGGIYWHTDAQSKRARRYLRQLTRELKRLHDDYNAG